MQIGEDIAFAASCLRDGKLVAIPTETVYGLAAVIRDDNAIASIFRVKNRPAFDPLIVHVGEKHWIKELCKEVPDKVMNLLDRVWPGPLTILMNKSEKVSDLVSAGLPTVAVRMPAHPMTLELLRTLGEPVAAPSANPFGYVSPTSAQHVANQLGEQLAYILDGGPSVIGLESTILSFTSDRPVVLRLGGMSLEALEHLLGERPELKISTHSNPLAPGQLDKHYATHIPLILTDSIVREVNKHSGKRLGLISFFESYAGLSIEKRRVLSPDADLNEAARNLFSALREMDQSGVELILAERFPERDLGRAINDRLSRAEGKK